MPVSVIRHTAGTQSYDITTVGDLNFAFTQAIVIPQMLANPKNDFTWPPQLDPDSLTEWVTANTGRISLANEPPNHTPEIWANGTEYAEWAESVYLAHPSLQSKMWIQSGKPEVVRYSPQPNEQLKHQSIINAAAAFTAANRLPRRIITTHKINPAQYASDYEAFYDELIQDYIDQFGGDVQLCFQEWNYGNPDTLSKELLASSGSFLINLARLKYANPDIISGAAYHQGYAVGGSHIFGLTALVGGNWFVSGLTSWWEEFMGLIYRGSYVSYAVTNKPITLDLAVIEDAGLQYILFANRSSSAVSFPKAATALTYWGESLIKQTGAYSGQLPANSTGFIKLWVSNCD